MYPPEQNSLDKPVLAKTTMKEYRRVLKLIAEYGCEPLQSIVSKSRARVIRAALRWCIEQSKQQDIATEPLPPEFALAMERIGGVDRANALINAIEVGGLKRRVGRVRKLNGLEPDWALRLILATEKEIPVEHAAVVSLFLTGCRIAELHEFQICL